jgi:hypothetical protein
MKIRHLILQLSFLFCTSGLFGKDQNARQLIFPFLPIECQSNIIVTADLDHPKFCSQEYTNLISNTNLFSLSEQKELTAVSLKYQNVTTNSGPTGSVFIRWVLRQRPEVKLTNESTWIEVTNIFQVACFAYTNSDSKEEIAFFPDNEIDARFRTKAGDGYDVLLFKNAIIKYQEYKNGLLDGLFAEIHDPNNIDDKEHCASWTRFVNGKIFGKYIMWQDGEIGVMADFKQPFDFLKYQTIKMDLSWSEAPSNSTNSIQSSDELNSTRQP